MKNCSDKFVLLVDDSFLNFALLEKTFGRFNIKVLWAKDGTDAIQIIKSGTQVDLVFMDVQLPNSNGFEIATQIKQIIDVPLIIHTAYDLNNEENISEFDGIIEKPIPLEKLESIIKKYLV